MVNDEDDVAAPVLATVPAVKVAESALGAGALNFSFVGLSQLTVSPSDSVPQHAHVLVVAL